MPELDPFERSLEAAFRAVAERGVAPVDAVAFTERVAGPPRARRGLVAVGPVPRLAWVLVAAGLLLAALLTAAVVGGWRLDRRPAVVPPLPSPAPAEDSTPSTPLHATGIEVLTPESTGYDRVVVDGRGVHWAIGPGHLTRFDPGTGARTTWTVSDDVAFGENGMIAPATAGGVWMQVGEAIRRFDGTWFRESIPAPGDGPITFTSSFAPAFEAAPDGTIWSLSLKHWDGSSWVDPPAGGPPWVELEPGFPRAASAGQQSPRLLARDGVWVATGATVAHLAGGQWTTFDPDDTGLAAQIHAIAEGGDGSIWLLDSEHRLIRLDGRTWEYVEGPGFTIDQLVVTADDSTWVVAGWPSTSTLAARYDGRRWTTFGAVEGLAGAGGTLSATPAGLFLSNGAGVRRLAGDRWVPAWEAQPGPVEPGQIIPVSRDEAWVVDGASLWHYRDSRWETPVPLTDLVTSGSGIGGVMLGPDDAIWVTGDNGVAVLRDGRWRTVAGPGLAVLAVDANGTAWASDGSDGGVAALSSDPGVPIRRFRCPNPAANVAVASDGSVYAGGSWQALGGSATVGLSRIIGTACSTVDPLGDGKAHDVWSVAAGPDGQVAAAVSTSVAASAGGSPDQFPDITIALFDGTAWRVIDPSSADSTACDTGQAAAAAPGSTVHFDAQGRLWQQSGLSNRPPEHFDGTRWIPAACPAQPQEGQAWDSRWVARDGASWYLGPSGVERIAAEP